MNDSLYALVRAMSARLARTEARLCQLMHHQGIDPQEHRYDKPRESVPLAPQVWRRKE